MRNRQLKRRFTYLGAMLLMPFAFEALAADDAAISTRTVVRPSSQNVSSDNSATDKSPVVSALAQDQVLSRLSGYVPVERVTNYPFGSSEPVSDSFAEPVIEKPRIRSEFGVSVGTGGYRSGYIASTIPLGKNGMLGIAFSKTDHGKNSYGYGYPYDYSPYGYDPYLYGDHLPGARITGRSLDVPASRMFPQTSDTERCRTRNASDDRRRFYGGNSGCDLTE